MTWEDWQHIDNKVCDIRHHLLFARNDPQYWGELRTMYKMQLHNLEKFVDADWRVEFHRLWLEMHEAHLFGRLNEWPRYL